MYGSSRGIKRTRARTPYGASKRVRLTRTTKNRYNTKRIGTFKAKAAPRRTIANNYARTKRNTYTAGRALKLARFALDRSYGNPQRQIQTITTALNPVATKPICFDMNDLAGGATKHCQFFQKHDDTHVQVINQFSKVEGPAHVLNDMWEVTEHNELNGPTHKALYAVYEFDFDAKVDDVYVRLDFLASTNKHFYQKDNQKTLPMALNGLQHLADHPFTNRINKDYFWRWRKPVEFYFNSRGTYQTTNLLAAVSQLGESITGSSDGNDFVREFPSTTPFRKKFRLYHKVTKVIRELNIGNIGQELNIQDLSTHLQDEDTYDGFNTTGGHLSSSSFQNKKVSDQRWCVISCSDNSANPILSDRVDIKISRYCVWRDQVGGT